MAVRKSTGKAGAKAVKNGTAAKAGVKAEKPQAAVAPDSQNDENTPQRSILTEAICILTLALALIVGMSLISNYPGDFGEAIRNALFGLFGSAAYLLPLFTGFFSFVIFFAKTRRVTWPKVVMSVALYIMFAAANNVFAEGEAGGFFGRHIGGFLSGALGLTSARVLVVAVIVVLATLVTGKSIFAFFAACVRVIAALIRRLSATEQDDDDEYDDEIPSAITNDTKEKPKPKRPAAVIPPPRKPVTKPEKEIIPKLPPIAAPNRPKTAFNFILDGPEPASEQAEQTDGKGDIPPEIPFTLNTPETPAAHEIQIKGVGVDGYVHKTVNIEVEGENTEAVAHIKDADTTAAVKPGDKPNDANEYIYPPIELLKENPYVPSLSSQAFILENSSKLEQTLKSFGVEAKVAEVCIGPTVTRYELSPGVGVKVSKISGLADDLALNLAAVGIRIEAPVPGKSVVGIEIPNKETQPVYLRDVINDEAFWAHPSKICFAIGKDIAGNTVITDIAKMPHLLIAGATGAGKSVCINTLVASIIYKANPDEVKLIMIDPKVVELSVYNGIPHLLIPVVTDPKKASGALNWAVREMDERYNRFAESMTRDLRGYNDTLVLRGENPLPQIVIIIDELADLMMTCGKEVEESICRLAQKARAAGIHLIIATQRPSVDVITGLIKANVPSRLAFAVSSGTDSRTILDMIGAEKLLGKGDMLFSPVGLSKPQRIQGSFISDKEVENLVNFIKREGIEEYDDQMLEEITSFADGNGDTDEPPEGDDEFTNDAIEFIITKEKASISMLQRRFRIGYNRAARLIEELEQKGVVGPEDGAKPRQVLMTAYQWQEVKRGKG